MLYFIISEIFCVIFLTRYFLEEVREDTGIEVLTQKETILGVITALFYDFFCRMYFGNDFKSNCWYTDRIIYSS